MQPVIGVLAAFVLAAAGIVLLLSKPHIDPVQCDIGQCPLQIRAGDSGKSFAYDVGARFSVVLDERHTPKRTLACDPGGIVGALSNEPDTQPPQYALTLEGVQPGTCMLRGDDFRVRIVIAAPH